jgi:YVTN family beta-propeller protein
VHLIDLDASSSVAVISVGSRPQGIAVQPGGNLVYAANCASNDVSVIHRGVNRVIATIPVGQAPYGVAFSPDGTRAYVTNAGKGMGRDRGTVSVIDTTAGAVIAEIEVGNLPWLGIAAGADCPYVFVSNRYSNDISAIDPRDNTVAYAIPSWDGPVGLAIDGDYLYCADAGRVEGDRNALSIIEWATGKTVKRLEEIRPFQIALVANRIFTTDYFHDAVSEVDADRFSLVKNIEGFSAPDGIAADPDGRHIYVANFDTPAGGSGAGYVSVIDRWAGEVVDAIAVGRNPAQIAVTVSDFQTVCPDFVTGGNLCVQEPQVQAGGQVTVTYAILPELASSLDAMLGVLTPWGDLYAFNTYFAGIRLLPSPPRVGEIPRVGARIPGGYHTTGTLTFPIPDFVPPGDYRFVAALVYEGMSEVLQMIESNTVYLR